MAPNLAAAHRAAPGRRRRRPSRRHILRAVPCPRAGFVSAPFDVEDLADIIDNPVQSREAFEATSANDLVGERALAGFFEAAYDALEELGGDHLTNRYFNLLSGFIDKFNLRYDLRRPCVLCPTLPGLFASLVSDLRALTSQDLHLDQLIKEYEDAVRDLRFGCTGGRIKTCIGKQFMLLEAIGALDPGETKNTLGDICDQLNSWPHATIKEALKKLYGFASDYPGIRHGSRAKGALRAIELRDMVAMSILLAGFTPYLERRLSADAIYGGSTINATGAPAVLPLPIPDSGNSGGNSQECQRRSKISPPGRSKTSPLNVMRYAVLGGCPGSP